MPEEIYTFQSLSDMQRVVDATRFVEQLRLQPPRPEIVNKGGALKRKVRILSEGKTAGHYLGRCLEYDPSDNTHSDLAGGKVWIADINDADLKLGIRYDAELAGYWTSAGGEGHAVYQTNAVAQETGVGGNKLIALAHVCLLRNIASYAGGGQTTINSATLTDLTGTEVTVKVFAPAPVLIVGVFDIRGNTAGVTFDCGSGNGSVDTFKGYLVKDGTPQTRVASFSPAHPLARATVIQVWPLSLDIGVYTFKLQGARAGASGGAAVFDTETTWAMYGDGLCVDTRTLMAPGGTVGPLERVAAESDCCLTQEVDVEGVGELSSDGAVAAAISVDIQGVGELSSDKGVGVAVTMDVQGIGELSSDRAVYAVVTMDVQGIGELSSDKATSALVTMDVQGIGELSSDQGMLVALAAYVMDVQGIGELSSDQGTAAAIAVDVQGIGELSSDQGTAAAIAMVIEGVGELSSDQGMLATIHNTAIDVQGIGELSSDAAVDTEIYDGRWKINDNNTNIDDGSRQNNDGTTHDTYQWVDETNVTNPQGYQWSLDLTQSGGRVEVPYISQYSVGTSSFTFSIWFLQNSLDVDASGFQWLFGQNDGTDWWALIWNPSAGASGQLQFLFHAGGVTNTVLTYDWPGAVGLWQQVAVRRETIGTAQAWSLWFNGASVATSSIAWTIPTLTTALVFGRAITGWVDVVISEALFWRAALKDARMAGLAIRRPQVTVQGIGELSSDAGEAFTPAVPGSTCLTALGIVLGHTYGPYNYTSGPGNDQWFTVPSVGAGTHKITINVTASSGAGPGTAGAKQGSCGGLTDKFDTPFDNTVTTTCNSGTLSAGQLWIKVASSGSNVTYTITVDTGTC